MRLRIFVNYANNFEIYVYTYIRINKCFIYRLKTKKVIKSRTRKKKSKTGKKKIFIVAPLFDPPRERGGGLNSR